MIPITRTGADDGLADGVDQGPKRGVAGPKGGVAMDSEDKQMS